jgi:uncharacterized protein YjbI with pentapeptide repeats
VRLSESRFQACRFVRCSFREATVEHCRFDAAEPRDACVFAFSRLDEARFVDCHLNLARLEKSTAVETVYERVSATGLMFDAAIRRRIAGKRMGGGISFRDCKLLYARFAETDLAGAVFAGSDLRDAAFRKADLTGADLRRTRLNNIDLTDATLDDADLGGADFDGFDLAALRSFRNMIASADQAAALLAAIGIRLG